MTFEEANQRYNEWKAEGFNNDHFCDVTNLYCDGKYEEAAAYIEQHIGCDHEIAVQLVKKHSAGVPVIKPNPNRQRYVPKCPTCGSPNIRKQFMSGGWFSKQFKCNNCGYEW